MTDYERDLAAGGKPVLSDYEKDLAAGGTPVETPPQRPTDVIGRLKFAFQHPIESLKDEIPKAITGATAASEDALNGASLGAYRQLRDARTVPEALLNTAPPSARTLENERFNAEHPLVANAAEMAGAMTGGPKMLAEAGGAVLRPVARTIDNAIGRKALEMWTAPPKPAGLLRKGFNKVVERGVHAAIGGAIGGVPGAIASQVVSPLAHDLVETAGNKLVSSLAQRHLLRTAAAAAPKALPMALEDILAQTSPETVSARPALAPLASEPLPSPAMPPGAFGAPMVDEFGMPLTRGGPVNHPTVGGATNPGGLRPEVVRGQLALPPMPTAFSVYEPPPFRAGPMRPTIDVRPEIPGLHADVVRDAKALARAPVQETAMEEALGGDLAKSVRLLDELRAGKITAQQAIDAGLPPGIVAKALH